MKPEFELKALMACVNVFCDRIVIEPRGVASWGGSEAKEIMFKDIQEIQIKKAGLLNGFMCFVEVGAENTKPMTIGRASNDPNSFVFMVGANQEVKNIDKYIRKQIENPTSSGEQAATFHKPLPSSAEDYEEYRRLTEAEDWAGIFEFNNSTIDNFSTTKELSVLKSYLAEDEVVFALASGILSQTEISNAVDFGLNTWLVALTDKRVLFLDHAMLSTSVDTQSIRHDKIQAVSASQGWMFGKLTIDIGNRSIVVDNCNKIDVKIFAKLANNWLESREEKDSSAKPSQSDPIAELGRLAELKSAGVLDDDEFAAAKAKVLSKM